MRAWVLLAILLLPGIAGCMGGSEAPRLAEPTTKPIIAPVSTPPRTPTNTYNMTDPGYLVTAPWRVGDGWDYESDASHYRQIRVLDSRLMSGTTFYVVEERFGNIGLPAARIVTSWVDGRVWAQLNATDQTGTVDRYHPGLPLRYYRNGSFSYNVTHVAGSGRADPEANVTVQSRLSGPHTTILFPWGYVEAKRVDQTPTTRVGGTTTAGSATTHWVHKDYLNDVQYQLPGGETFKLVAAKAGDFRRGKLAT